MPTSNTFPSHNALVAIFVAQIGLDLTSMVYTFISYFNEDAGIEGANEKALERKKLTLVNRSKVVCSLNAT
jgi:hypothetical protein